MYVPDTNKLEKKREKVQPWMREEAHLGKTNTLESLIIVMLQVHIFWLFQIRNLNQRKLPVGKSQTGY